MAEFTDFPDVYRRAFTGDRDAQADLWLEYRPRMHRVIRLKAADLHLEWAVDPDDIYDSFFVELFHRAHCICFADARHFARYVAKSLRRRTRRCLFASRNQSPLSFEVLSELVAADSDVVDEAIWAELLDAAYLKLTQRERMICKLVRDGCSWQEVGQHLDLAPDTARMIYQRAVARVREEVLG